MLGTKILLPISPTHTRFFVLHCPHPTHLAAEHVDQALEAHANAEHRHTPHSPHDNVARDARVGARVPGTGGDDNAVDLALGVQRLDLGEGDLVIAHDERVAAQTREVRVHVPRERVVVVDHEGVDHFVGVGGGGRE